MDDASTLLSCVLALLLGAAGLEWAWTRHAQLTSRCTRRVNTTRWIEWALKLSGIVALAFVAYYSYFRTPGKHRTSYRARASTSSYLEHTVNLRFITFSPTSSSAALMAHGLTLLHLFPIPADVTLPAPRAAAGHRLRCSSSSESHLFSSLRRYALMRLTNATATFEGLVITQHGDAFELRGGIGILEVFVPPGLGRGVFVLP